MLHCDGKLPRQMYRLSTSITFRQLVLLYVDKVFVGLLSGGLQGTSSYLCEAPLPGEGTLKIYIYIYIYIYLSHEPRYHLYSSKMQFWYSRSAPWSYMKSVTLTFIGPCIANIFSEYNYQDAKFHNLFIWRSTCVRRVFRPSSGAQNCTYSVRYLSDQYLTLYVQFWAPDDGRKTHLKHVKRLTEINKLWNNNNNSQIDAIIIILLII